MFVRELEMYGEIFTVEKILQIDSHDDHGNISNDDVLNDVIWKPVCNLQRICCRINHSGVNLMITSVYLLRKYN